MNFRTTMSLRRPRVPTRLRSTSRSPAVPGTSGIGWLEIGITARPIEQSNRPACNLVFLIDVSPSMQQPDRLPLVQWSLERLIDQLGERDRLAIVAFGPTPEVVLASTSGMAKSMIRAAVDDLRVEAQDATRSGSALAYEIAGQSFVEQGTNRVILVTDASSKIGAMGQDDLIGLVAAKRVEAACP